jgi:hypothetical protein
MCHLTLQARRNCDKAGFHKEVMDPALEGQCPPKAAKLFAALAVGMCSHVSDPIWVISPCLIVIYVMLFPCVQIVLLSSMSCYCHVF